MSLKEIQDYGIVPRDIFLSWDWYRIGYGDADHVGHLAKFSNKGPGILMTNTSSDKDGFVFFYDLNDAEPLLEAIKGGKSKAMYEFEIKEVPERNMKRLIKDCSQAAVCQILTKYGSAYQVIPLKDDYKLNPREKAIVEGGKQFLRKNDMRGFIDYMLKARFSSYEIRCGILSFFYAQGVDAFSYLT